MEYGKTPWSDAKISRIVQGTIMLTEREWLDPGSI